MSDAAEPQTSEPSYWWVNQRPETYQAEKVDCYLFAPVTDRLGKEHIQHKNMAQLKRGDIVIHCSSGHIKAISRVLKPAEQGKRRVPLTSSPNEGNGQIAPAEYEELATPFKLEDISLELRKTQARETFDRNGHRMQRYITRLNPEFVAKLRDQFSELDTKLK